MSPRLPAIRARIMMAFLEDLGFQRTRQKGSHHFFRHPDGRTATIPDHGNEDLGRGITGKIFRDAEITREDFWEWYDNK